VASWDDLTRELDAWRALGRAATLWWRDDDACDATPALEHLLALRADAGVSLAVAAVPAAATPALARRLAESPDTLVLAHGYAHRNHAPAGERKQELGPHRPRAAVAAELERGLGELHRRFDAQARAVLVPPWNRIHGGILGALPGLGFVGLSGLGPRACAEPVPGLWQSNVHADPVDWRAGRRFAGLARALEPVCAHLRARRAGRVDPAEPTGLMTHHLTHDPEGWRFLEALLARTRNHPAARWLGVDEVFPQRGARLSRP